MKKAKNLDLKSNRDGFVISVAIALLIAAILLGYYIAVKPAQEGYVTIYLLDSQKKAIEYPERLVAGENSTFSVYVEVENHKGTMDYQVQVKVTNETTPTYPLIVDATETFNGTVQDGTTWENVSTISLNQPGEYKVIFELWTFNNGTPQFSGEFTQLNLQVTV